MRPVSRFLAASVLAATTMLGPWTTPAATAATGDLTCNGNFQLNFSPALTAATTSSGAAGSANLVNCVSPNGKYARFSSGVAIANGTATSVSGAPCSLLLTISGTTRITWNTGEVSKADFTINTNPAARTVTVSAVVVSGPMAGDSVAGTAAEANPNVDCATNGLKSLTSTFIQETFG